MRVEVVRTTAVVAALVVLLAGFTGGYATTALFSDREGIEVAVAAAGPAPEQPAARYHVFGGETAKSGDGFGVDHHGTDVVLVSVVDGEDDALDLVVSRVVEEPATVRVALNALAAHGVDASSFTVLVDGRDAPHRVVDADGESWILVPLTPASTHAVSFVTVHEPAYETTNETTDPVDDGEPVSEGGGEPNDDGNVTAGNESEFAVDAEPAPEADDATVDDGNVTAGDDDGTVPGGDGDPVDDENVTTGDESAPADGDGSVEEGGSTEDGDGEPAPAPDGEPVDDGEAVPEGENEPADDGGSAPEGDGASTPEAGTDPVDGGDSGPSIAPRVA